MRERPERAWELLRGANHDFFNTVWSPSSGEPWALDDWGGSPVESPDAACRPGGPGRLTEDQHRPAATAWFTSFFREHLGGGVGGETAYAPVWQGRKRLPSTFAPLGALVSYHAPAADRRDVNRLMTDAALAADASGGPVA